MGSTFRMTLIATAVAASSAAAGAPTLSVTLLGSQNTATLALPIPGLPAILNSLTLQPPPSGASPLAGAGPLTDLLAVPPTALPSLPGAPALPSPPNTGAIASQPSGLAALPGASMLTGLLSSLTALITGHPPASGGTPAPSLPPQALNGAASGNSPDDGGALSKASTVSLGVSNSLPTQ